MTMTAPTGITPEAWREHLATETMALLADLPLSEQVELLERWHRTVREKRGGHVYDTPGAHAQ